MATTVEHPTPREVADAVRWLDGRIRRSCEGHIQWSRNDRVAARVLLAYVERTTAQRKRAKP